MKKLLFLPFLFFAVYVAVAQPAPEAKPVAGGMDATRLQRIDKLIQQYIDNKWLNGAVAIIYRKGELVYYKAIGYDNLETKTPMRKDEIFRIASQTKAITSVAIMMLYEEGKLLLDEPVSKYIAEFKQQQVLDKFNEADSSYTTVPVKRDITIRDLLSHTSGIGYAQIGNKTMNAIYAKAGIPAGIGIGRILLADKMKLLGKQPLFHQPGEKFTYGLNTDLLGYLVEVISGMSLNDFFRTRIFEPLGMKDTYFYLPSAKQNRLATLYTEDAQQNAIKAPEHTNLNGDFYRDYPNTDGTYFSGGGGLSSTAYDYAIFLQMLLNNGEYKGKRILSAASVRMMTSNQIGDLTVGNVNKFGLGFELTTTAGSARSPLNEGSYRWGGMFSSNYWVDPKEKMLVQVFLNIYPNHHSDLHEKLRMLIYQAINN